MDEITETPRSLATEFLKLTKRLLDIANPLKGREKIGIPSVISEISDDPMSRRRFLQHLGILGLTTLAPVLFRDIDQRTQPKRRTSVPERVEVLDPLEERLFRNFSPEEKTTIESAIGSQIEIYNKTNDRQRSELVLDWEKTTIKPILDRDVKPQDSQFWSKLLSAIVYVESEGKPLAESEIGAIGLAQLTVGTARQTAQKHGIFKFDLLVGWDNLRLSRFHLEDLMDRYGPNIALLGYYAGQPFTDQKVLVALEKSGVNKQDSIMKKGVSSNAQLRLYIDHYRINIANLGSEHGKEYFKKVVAAMRILKQARV